MVEKELFSHIDTGEPTEATVRVDAGRQAESTVEPKLFGKFCEHLGNNIYHGMDAQILFNPTFGEWHFRSERRQSGGFGSETDLTTIREQVEAQERPFAYPKEVDSDALLAAYQDGLAFGWQPTNMAAVTSSPDTGPTGDRAQRLETTTGGEGIFQQTRLPLHRIKGYEFRLKARATDNALVEISLRSSSNAEELDIVSLHLSQQWETFEGSFEIPDSPNNDAVYEMVVTLPKSANIVLDRLLLYPEDHINYADPDVIEFLQDSELPLLRWPGGNFASGYNWYDGIGPIDERPTRINPSWGGLEYNLFGTAEFVTFCENVGCEPMICVNAGNGTPEDAAAWVKYCNGDPEETEMGALRAEHGHEEPFNITYWEIGNELHGKWQVHWTTPEGNADRYSRFRKAMLNADPDIKVTACGTETDSDGEWNDVLLDRCGENIRALSEHILAGGKVDATTDPDELYHAFMGFPHQIRREFDRLQTKMEEAGIDTPKLDITELQIFATFQTKTEENDRAEECNLTESSTTNEKLSPETMPTPTTISEALYDAVIRHQLIRMGEFVEMLTHSATVNHGGGLWKQGERVWPNPCHYGRSMSTALAEKTPIAVKTMTGTLSTETEFGEIEPVNNVPAVDAMAAIDDDRSELTMILVNCRSADKAMDVSIEIERFETALEAQIDILAGETMYDANTRNDPQRIVPRGSKITIEDNTAVCKLPPYSMARITIPTAESP